MKLALCVDSGEAGAGCSLPLDGIVFFSDVFMGVIQRSARNDLPFAMREGIPVWYTSTLKLRLISFNSYILYDS